MEMHSHLFVVQFPSVVEEHAQTVLPIFRGAVTSLTRNVIESVDNSFDTDLEVLSFLVQWKMAQGADDRNVASEPDSQSPKIIIINESEMRRR